MPGKRKGKNPKICQAHPDRYGQGPGQRQVYPLFTGNERLLVCLRPGLQCHPLYLKKVVELNPAVDIITMANPFVIVFFQLLVIKLFGKMKPTNSIIVGAIIIGFSMIINVGPIFLFGGVRNMTLGNLLPLGSLFAVLTVAMIAFGELFAAARQFEYIGALAPKGQEGLFLGYANLPMALGALAGNPIGAVIFNEIMCHKAVKLESGLLELHPLWNSMGWIIPDGRRTPVSSLYVAFQPLAKKTPGVILIN
jgi:hypothetical protein